MIELLQKLISIPSVSSEEKQIADWVQGLLGADNTERIGNTVIWKNQWQPQRLTLALGAHLDTVPYDENKWTITHPLKPVIVGDKLYGRGACDMKSGAAILLDLLIKREFGSQFNLLFFWYEMEELGMPNGVTTLLEKGYFQGVDLCIIPEPTEGKVNNGVFGNLDVRVTAHGKAAHSAYPERGDNALYKLLPLIEEIRNYPLGGTHGVREAMSINVISGGKAINIIPERVQMELDYRYHPDRTKDELEHMLAQWQKEDISVEIIGLNPGVLHRKGSSLLLDHLIEHVGQSEVVPFWSDMGQLGAAGITCVNFGPGSIRQAHISDEYVSLSDVHRVRSLLSIFLQTDPLLNH